MNSRKIKFSTSIFLIFFCFFQNSISQNLPASIDSLMNFMHEKYNFDGVVLVADKDNVIYEKAFGQADRNNNIFNATDTKFRLGSISKQFIGFIIIMLAEEGMLNLDEPLSKYFNVFESDDKKNIRIRNLLTHTSGIFNYTDMKEFDSKIPYEQDSLLNMIAARPLNFAPGTNYSYSNSNFYICCALAEKAGGKKFEELLKEKILQPAGLYNTGIEKNSITLTNMALPYVFADGKFIDGEYIEMDNVAAGMYSNADDLLKWSLFMQKELSSDTFLKAALVPFHLTDGTEKIYSCGWSLLPDKILHQGHINGFANHISIDTINHFTVIMLTNNDFQHLFAASRTISSLLNGNSSALNWIGKDLKNISLKEYDGIFTLGNDSINNKFEDGKLVSYIGGQTLKWKPYLKDEFFSEDFEGIIWFERDDKNKIAGITSYEDYVPVFWKKVR